VYLSALGLLGLDYETVTFKFKVNVCLRFLLSLGNHDVDDTEFDDFLRHLKERGIKVETA
jgi:hypothetical protein